MSLLKPFVWSFLLITAAYVSAQDGPPIAPAPEGVVPAAAQGELAVSITAQDGTGNTQTDASGGEHAELAVQGQAELAAEGQAELAAAGEGELSATSQNQLSSDGDVYATQEEFSFSSETTIESLHIQHSSSFLVESACEGLPFRSAFIGSRCFVAVPKGPTGNTPESVCGSLFKGAHPDGLELVSKPAEIDRKEVEEELFRARILKQNVRYSVTRHYASKTYIEVVDATSAAAGTRAKRDADDVVLCQFVGESSCPQGYTEINRKCYKFNPEPVEYEKAVEICAQDEAHLPVVNNDEENRLLADFCRNDQDGVWLATQLLGQWVHSAGRRKTPHYFRWLRFNEDGSGTHALLTSKSGPTFGYWRNVPAGNAKHPYVCQHRPVLGAPSDSIPDCQPTTARPPPPTKPGAGDNGGNPDIATDPGEEITTTVDPNTLPTIPIGGDDNPCPMNADGTSAWYHYKPSNKCFMVVKNNTGLTTAPQHLEWCKLWNGTLAAIHSFEEQKYVYELVKANASDAKSAWIGLMDTTGKRQWRWTDGTAYDYTYWELKKPDNQGPMCSMIQMTKDKGLWDDVPCTATDVYCAVCQYTPTVEWEKPGEDGGGGLPPIEPAEGEGNGCPPCAHGDYSCWEKFPQAKKCYKVIYAPNASPSMYNFDQACRAINGTLAAVHSQPEMNFLIGLANRHRHLIGWSNLTWIGLHNPSHAVGKWRWTDGSAYDYKFWQPTPCKMPDNHGGEQYCMHLKMNMHGWWDDVNCNTKVIVTGICQYMIGVGKAPPAQYDQASSYTGTPCIDSSWHYFEKTKKCYKYLKSGTNLLRFESHAARKSPISDCDLRYLSKGYELVTPNSKNAAWIGLRQQGVKAPFKWLDGAPLKYTRWDKGQPNNAFINGAKLSEFCTFLQLKKYRADVTPGTWDDASCGAANAPYAICQHIPGPKAASDASVAQCKAAANSQPAAGPCPTGWSYLAAAKKCFKLVSVKQPATSPIVQRLACWAESGQAWGELASIRSAAEANFVWNLVKHLVPCRTLVWTGLRIGRPSGPWTWMDGTTYGPYHNWIAGQPKPVKVGAWTPLTTCGFVNLRAGGKWIPAGCAKVNNAPDALCQIDLVRHPIPKQSPPPARPPQPAPAQSAPVSTVPKACQRPARCPTGWTYYRPTHKCFYIVKSGGMPISFFNYENVCQFSRGLKICGGHLAQISHAQENAFVLNLARSNLFPRGAPTLPNLAVGLKASVWIGYRIPGRADLIKKHEFRWVDGSPNHFFNWMPATPGKTEWFFAKQPDNHRPSENCVIMSLGSYFPGTWADITCDGAGQVIAGAVCQIRLAGTPAPVALGKG